MSRSAGPHVIMHIVSLAWLFVAAMIAIGQGSVMAAVLSFVAWGPLPLALFWYLFGRRKRK